MSSLDTRRHALAAGVGGLVVWIAAWLWIGRFHHLDDALIHLRYAETLAKTGLFSYNGSSVTYGSSSPLYVILLAGLRSLGTTSPFLAKGVSIAAYLALLVGVVRLNASDLYRSRWHQAGWLLTLAALAGPMAVRWLSDGMETSLVLLALFGFAWLLQGRPEPPRTLPLAFVAFGLVILRVDLAVAVACAGLALALEDLTPQAGDESRAGLREAVALAAGTVLAIGLLWSSFGSVLPDPAAAKSGVPVGLLGAISTVAVSGIASLGLGAFLTAAWLATTVALYRNRGPAGWVRSLPVHILPLLLLGLIAWRGQVLHGVRHVLWGVAFPVAWNLWSLQRASPISSERPSTGGRRVAGALLLVAVVFAWITEAFLVTPVLVRQGETFRSLRQADLSALEGTTGAAFDVGFIGYFTGAEILDASGLVNGAAAAARSAEERAAWIASRNPDFLFVTAEQAEFFEPWLSLNEYSVTGSYAFPTLRRENLHLLAVRRPLVDSVTVPTAPSLEEWLPETGGRSERSSEAWQEPPRATEPVGAGR